MSFRRSGPSLVDTDSTLRSGKPEVRLEIDRPRRLVFTFAMPQFSPNCDTITIEIVPDGTGCIMTFTQAGIDISSELRELGAGHKGGTEQGWTVMFDGLAAALGRSGEEKAARPDPTNLG